MLAGDLRRTVRQRGCIAAGLSETSLRRPRSRVSLASARLSADEAAGARAYAAVAWARVRDVDLRHNGPCLFSSLRGGPPGNRQWFRCRRRESNPQLGADSAPFVEDSTPPYSAERTIDAAKCAKAGHVDSSLDASEPSPQAALEAAILRLTAALATASDDVIGELVAERRAMREELAALRAVGKVAALDGPPSREGA